jgi:hypothetical protein
MRVTVAERPEDLYVSRSQNRPDAAACALTYSLRIKLGHQQVDNSSGARNLRTNDEGGSQSRPQPPYLTSHRFCHQRFGGKAWGDYQFLRFNLVGQRDGGTGVSKVFIRGPALADGLA